jgi:hypothetical protein
MQSPDIHDRGADDRERIDPVMAVEVLVLGGEEGIDDPLWNRLDRHEDAPLDGVFGQRATITRVDAGHDRRLIMGELPDSQADRGRNARSQCRRRCSRRLPEVSRRQTGT